MSSVSGGSVASGYFASRKPPATAFASNYININKFSLHSLHRNRLIRAYLGASRGQRTPNPFTGFDPLDNLPMTYLNPAFLWPEDILDSGALASGLEWATAATPHVDLQAFHERLNGTQAKPRLFFKRRLAARTEARVIQAVNDLIAGPLLRVAEERPSARLTVADLPHGEGGLPQTVSNRMTIECLCPGTIRTLATVRPNRCLHVLNTAWNLVKGQRRRDLSPRQSSLGAHAAARRSIRTHRRYETVYLSLGQRPLRKPWACTKWSYVDVDTSWCATPAMIRNVTLKISAIRFAKFGSTSVLQ